MKNIKVRATSAIVLLLILIPCFLITYFAKVPGKVIGLAFFMVFSSWATYEVISHNKLHQSFNIIFAVLVSITWFFPFDWFKTTSINPNAFWETKTTGFNHDFLILTIKHLLFFGKDEISGLNALSISTIFIFSTIIFLFNARKYESTIEFFKEYIICLFALLFIPIFSKALYIYNVANLYIFFAIFLIPIIADTSAYFGGMLLGHKIIKRGFAPHISPKKTWEGAIIGYLFAALFVFIAMYLGKMTNNSQFMVLANYKQLIVAIILLPAVSQIGDLSFSLIKRKMNIKDFSNLIPGHGGLMDRFDSVSFVTLSLSLIFLIK
ncbi:phosphatidate cytidylyltransferase [Metamycoplasma equirhinis]|uniref:phosphatidate cytidylyltransferase n=1 Tax=Metamycoplasma equirhinis TaxID=92402 RepID=UPI003593E98C